MPPTSFPPTKSLPGPWSSPRTAVCAMDHSVMPWRYSTIRSSKSHQRPSSFAMPQGKRPTCSGSAAGVPTSTADRSAETPLYHLRWRFFRRPPRVSLPWSSALRSRGLAPSSPSDQAIGWDRQHMAPPTTGHCRLIDGTRILAAGDKDPAGDPIRTTLDMDGRKIRVEGVGVIAVRLARDGHLDALAGGGLKLFEAGPFRLALERPVDLALWRRADGQYEGVLQDWSGSIPPPLRAHAALVPFGSAHASLQVSRIRIHHRVPEDTEKRQKDTKNAFFFASFCLFSVSSGTLW